GAAASELAAGRARGPDFPVKYARLVRSAAGGCEILSSRGSDRRAAGAQRRGPRPLRRVAGRRPAHSISGGEMTMRRETCIVLGVFLAALTGGCKTFQTPKFPWTSEAQKKAQEARDAPVRMAAIWTDAAITVPGKPVMRG